MLADYKPDTSITFARNPNYWRKDPLHPENTLPYIDMLKMLVIPDKSTAMAAMRTGGIDMIASSSITGGSGTRGTISLDDALSLIQGNPKLEHVEYPGTRMWTLGMRTDKPELPWTNLKVRQALNMAIDKQTIVDTFYQGHASVQYPLLGNYPEYSSYRVRFENLPESTRALLEYHPDKAKQLMTEAGFASGFTATVVCRQTDIDALMIVRDYWKKNLNVELKFDIKDSSTFLSFQGKHEQMMIMDNFQLDSVESFYPYKTVGAFNFSTVNDTKANEMITLFSNNWRDRNKQLEILADYTPYIIDQAWYPYWPVQNNVNLWHPWVKNFYGCSVYPEYEYYYVWIDQDMKAQMKK